VDLLPEPIPDTTDTIAPNDLWDLARKGQVRLIDVRTTAEFARAHVKGANNIPVDRFDPAAIVRDETAPIYLICRGGTRSREAYARVRACSPDARVAVLDGGMLAWLEADLPVVRGRPGQIRRLGRNVALGTVGISVLLAIFVNKGLIGIAGLVGAVVVAVMMFDKRRWWIVADDEVTRA
jgi:rhodanese-related sulfurtransferase